MAAALGFFKIWGAAQTDRRQQLLSRGPYLVYVKQYDITIGGQKYVAAPDAAASDPPSMRDSVFMMRRSPADATTYYGVLREVWLLRPPGEEDTAGAALEADLQLTTCVLKVDWFMPVGPTAAEQAHTGLKCPVLLASFMSATEARRRFAPGSMCNPQDIVPTPLVLVKSLQSANKLMVLHRHAQHAGMAAPEFLHQF
jgi:hypothetical protein